MKSILQWYIDEILNINDKIFNKVMINMPKFISLKGCRQQKIIGINRRRRK